MKMATGQAGSAPAERPENHEWMRELARHASLEATPRQILSGAGLSGLLAAGSCVYVPFLPQGRFSESLEACQRLLEQGMVAVPHLPARRVESVGQLGDWLAELREAGVDRLMLIAGDTDRVAGPFPDTLALLESGLLLHHDFHRLGVAGYPEGHPLAGPDTLGRALTLKREYAVATGTQIWVVTQFAFEAEHYISWLQALGDSLPMVPVYVGIAGPTNLKTLMAYAAQCGVGVSAKSLWRRPGTARLLRAWSPDEVVQALARHRRDFPDTWLRGLHLFPFGGLARSARWLNHLGNTDQAPGEPSPAGS